MKIVSHFYDLDLEGEMERDGRVYGDFSMAGGGCCFVEPCAGYVRCALEMVFNCTHVCLQKDCVIHNTMNNNHHHHQMLCRWSEQLCFNGL